MKRTWFGVSAVFYLSLTILCFCALFAPRNFAVMWLWPCVFLLFGNAILFLHKNYLRTFGLVVSFLGIIIGLSPFIFFGLEFFKFGVAMLPFAAILFLATVCFVGCIKKPAVPVVYEDEE